MKLRTLIATLPLLAGCAAPTQLARVEMPVTPPERWTAADLPAGELSGTWWQDFNDTRLDAIVEAALAENFDLQRAAAIVAQARAQARIAGAPRLPSVSAGLDARRGRQNFIGLPIPGEGGEVLSNTSTALGVSLNVSWEVDLWDRLGARARAGMADYEAARADYAAARLSLVGQAIKVWFAAAEARQQVALAEATVETFESSAAQVKRRYEMGIRSPLDLRLALANLDGAHALLELRRQQYDAIGRQLEILLGRYPALTLEVPEALPDAPDAVPEGLPADIIARRPDLVAAERRLVASDHRWGASKRDLYPRLSLTASAGTSTTELSDLVNGDFGVWNLVGNLLQPIFQGGALRAAVELADAGVDASLAQYASSALRAYGEVETALAAEELLAKRTAYLADAAQQSRAAERLADQRYRSGLEAFVTVLESQRRSLDAQSAWISARRERLDNRVDLYLALGGGFDGRPPELDWPTAEPTAEASPGPPPGPGPRAGVQDDE